MSARIEGDGVITRGRQSLTGTLPGMTRLSTTVLQQYQRPVRVAPCIPRQPDAAERSVGETAAAFGRLDILINMASIYTAVPFDDLSASVWDRQLSVDLRAAFLFSHACVPAMRQQGGGRIINFTDWVAASARPRYPGYTPYYVAKAGVKALTETLALELAGDQILVNAIAPGPILAPPEMSQDETEAVVRSTPLGRWGGEDEIAKAVMFLVNSDFVTGETIRVDGGRHIK